MMFNRSPKSESCPRPAYTSLRPWLNITCKNQQVHKRKYTVRMARNNENELQNKIIYLLRQLIVVDSFLIQSMRSMRIQVTRGLRTGS